MRLYRNLNVQSIKLGKSAYSQAYPQLCENYPQKLWIVMRKTTKNDNESILGHPNNER